MGPGVRRLLFAGPVDTLVANPAFKRPFPGRLPWPADVGISQQKETKVTIARRGDANSG